MQITRKNIENFKAQDGWTIWSMMFTLGTLGFFAFVGMQLVPVYNANQNVVNAMVRSMDGKDAKKATRAQIIKDMQGQLYLDGSHQLLDYKDDLKVTRDKSALTIAVDYERRIPMFANISIVAAFDPVVKCDFSGKCGKE